LLIFPSYALATHAIFTPSLHDALPILDHAAHPESRVAGSGPCREDRKRKAQDRLWSGIALPERRTAKNRCPMHWDRRLVARRLRDRKSTRLNSSHQIISYAVFCLQKDE